MSNVIALGSENLVFCQEAGKLNGPVVQATMVFEEATGNGVMTVIGDNILGGMGVLMLTPEIVDGIKSLIEEFNNTVGPEYA